MTNIRYEQLIKKLLPANLARQLFCSLCESDFKTSSSMRAVLSVYCFSDALQNRGSPLTIGSCALKRFLTDFSWLAKATADGANKHLPSHLRKLLILFDEV